MRKGKKCFLFYRYFKNVQVWQHDLFLSSTILRFKIDLQLTFCITSDCIKDSKRGSSVYFYDIMIKTIF